MDEDDFRYPGGWPVGDVNVPYAELADHLVYAACLHARRAVLDRHAMSLLSLLDAASSCGAAVELLAKACIAKVEPALLAAPASRDGAPPTSSLLHLRGHADRVTGSAVRDVATIMVKPAIQLASDLHRRITVTPKQLSLVLDVRNAAVHLGLVQDDLLVEAVVLMATFVDQALPALDETPDEFWTPQVAKLVRSLLDERSGEVAKVVHELIAQAGQHYRTTFGRLDEPSRTVLVSVMEANKPSGGLDASQTRCPACDHMGWVIVDVDVDVEPMGGGEYDSHEYLFTKGFECPVCGLLLEPEMFEAAGIDTTDKSSEGSDDLGDL